MESETIKKIIANKAEEFYPVKTDDLICAPKLVRDAYTAGATEMYNDLDGFDLWKFKNNIMVSINSDLKAQYHEHTDGTEYIYKTRDELFEQYLNDKKK